MSGCLQAEAQKKLVMQQNNDKHQSESSTELLQRHRIYLLEWNGQSPDCGLWYRCRNLNNIFKMSQRVCAVRQSEFISASVKQVANRTVFQEKQRKWKQISDTYICRHFPAVFWSTMKSSWGQNTKLEYRTLRTGSRRGKGFTFCSTHLPISIYMGTSCYHLLNADISKHLKVNSAK